MKRKSILVLIAILALAVSLPLFSLAETATEAPEGVVVDATQLTADDIFIGEDGFCYTLDENGEAQRVYARGIGGRYMALRSEDGVYCWALSDDADALQAQRGMYSRWAQDDDASVQTQRGAYGRWAQDDDTATVQNRRYSNSRGGCPRWN